MNSKRSKRKKECNKREKGKEIKIFKNKKETDFYIIIFILIISSVIIFNKLSVLTLNDWDESRNGENALEILKTNDWGVLNYGGQPDLWNLKPPLGAWLIAIGYKIFGYGEFALRFWSAIFGIGTILIIYLFGKELANRYVGLFGSLSLLANKTFIDFHVVRTGDYDSAITFFITLGMFFFYLFEKRENKIENRKYLYGFSIAISLAVLVKGIIGLFPIIIIFIYYIISYLIRSLERYLKKEHSNKLEIDNIKNSIIGNSVIIRNSIIIFITITFPWFVYRYIRGRDFIEKMIEYDIIQRTGQSIEGHIGDWKFYLDVLLNTYGIKAYSDIHNIALILIIFLIGFSIYYFRRDRILILPIWILFFLSIFTIAKTKIFWYIIPIYPAIGLLVGYYIYKIDYKILILSILLLFIPIYSVVEYTEHPYIDPLKSSIRDSRQYLEDLNTLYIDSAESSQSIYLYLNFYSKNVSYDEKNIKKGDGIITFDSGTANLLKSKKEYKLTNQTDYLAIFKKING